MNILSRAEEAMVGQIEIWYRELSAEGQAEVMVVLGEVHTFRLSFFMSGIIFGVLIGACIFA